MKNSTIQFRTIHVAASSSYDILIGDNMLSHLGEELHGLLGECRLALLTDSNGDAL